MKQGLGVALALIAAAAAAPFLPIYDQHILILVALYGALALAWNILGGMTGQISLGHALFVGVGAYVSTGLFVLLGVNPWIGLLCAMLVGAGAGAGIGYVVFRRKLVGVYFALVTLALAEIALEIVSNIPALGGANGLSITPQPGLARLQFASNLGFCYASLALLALVCAVVLAISRSRLGYVLLAIRENEKAAAALGVDVIGGKVTAAAISGALAAMVGPIYANYVLFIDPDSVLGASLSIDALVYAFVGGLGSLFGPLLGAAVLAPLTEILRGLLGGRLAGAHLVVYGVILILAMRFAPQGLWGVGARLARRGR